MKQRFKQLFERIKAQDNVAQEFSRLNTWYSDPKRFYHNIDHIKNCLIEFDFAKSLLENADIVELAIWYHDAIYNPRAKDNEIQSAELVYDVCIASQLPESFAKGARDLILTTKHLSVPEDHDAKVLVDIDLSILGQPKEEFDLYERNIRKEYSWVDEEEFRTKRRKILQMFQDRGIIYQTDFFRAKYESSARANIQRSIDSLR